MKHCPGCVQDVPLNTPFLFTDFAWLVSGLKWWNKETNEQNMLFYIGSSGKPCSEINCGLDWPMPNRSTIRGGGGGQGVGEKTLIYCRPRCYTLSNLKAIGLPHTILMMMMIKMMIMLAPTPFFHGRGKPPSEFTKILMHAGSAAEARAVGARRVRSYVRPYIKRSLAHWHCIARDLFCVTPLKPTQIHHGWTSVSLHFY